MYNGVDLDTFSENYVTLLNSLYADKRRTIVSCLLPRARKSVDLIKAIKWHPERNMRQERD